MGGSNGPKFAPNTPNAQNGALSRAKLYLTHTRPKLGYEWVWVYTRPKKDGYRVDGYFGKIPDLSTNVGYFCRVWVSGIASGAQPW